MAPMLAQLNFTMTASMELFQLFLAPEKDALCGKTPVDSCTGVAGGRLGQHTGGSGGGGTGKKIGILIAVVASLVVTYFVVGTLYKRYHGARGADQIPHVGVFRACLSPCGVGGGAMAHTRLESAFDLDLDDDEDDDEVLKM